MAKNDSGPIGAGSGFTEKPQAGHQAVSTAESFGDHALLIRLVTDGTPKILLGLAVGAALSFSAIALWRNELPPFATYRSGITVTMPSAADGKYPNGSAFAISDLRSPIVLEEVYRANNLSKYGLKLEDFIGMISVSPYSPAYDSVVERFQGRLTNKALTFEERQAIEDEFRNTIRSLTAGGAIVALSLPDSGVIPASLAAKIVDDIPAKWAEIYIGRLGVANLPLPASGTTIVDAGLIGELDYPLAYDYLTSRIGIVLEQIKNLKDYSGTVTFISEKTGKSIDDIQRDLTSLSEYRVTLGLRPFVDRGLSRDPATTLAIYDNVAKTLEQDTASQLAYSEKLSTVLDEYGARSNAISGQTDGSAGNVQPGVNSGMITLGQPIDSSLIDKVIRLSNRQIEFEFEKGLLERKLDFENTGISFNERKLRTIERRNAILNGSLAGEERIMAEAKFTKGMTRAINDVNQIWSDVLLMTDELNLKRYNNDKVLYQLSNLSAKTRIEKPSVFSMNNLLLALVITLVGGAIGLLHALWRNFIRPA